MSGKSFEDEVLEQLGQIKRTQEHLKEQIQAQNGRVSKQEAMTMNHDTRLTEVENQLNDLPAMVAASVNSVLLSNIKRGIAVIAPLTMVVIAEFLKEWVPWW